MTHIRSFMAKGPHGEDYEIHVWREDVPIRGRFGGGPATAPGHDVLRDDSGREVTLVDKGRYEMEDGTPLTSDDPSSP